MMSSELPPVVRSRPKVIAILSAVVAGLLGSLYFLVPTVVSTSEDSPSPRDRSDVWSHPKLAVESPASVRTTRSRNSEVRVAEGQQISNGVQPPSASIDWSKLRQGYPIPWQFPIAESENANGAGFAREWILRSVKGQTAQQLFDFYVIPRFDALPVVLAIASRDKDPSDVWGYGVESEIRKGISKTLEGTDATRVRVFCNNVGCLCYFEGMSHQYPERVFLDGLKEDWTKDFGIERANLHYLNGGTGKDHSYVLIIVTRYGPEETLKRFPIESTQDDVVGPAG